MKILVTETPEYLQIHYGPFFTRIHKTINTRSAKPVRGDVFHMLNGVTYICFDTGVWSIKQEKTLMQSYFNQDVTERLDYEIDEITERKP